MDSEDPKQAVILALIAMNTKFDDAYARKANRERALRQELEEKLRTNPEILELASEQQLWYGAVDRAAEEVLVPGTLLRYDSIPHNSIPSSFHVIASWGGGLSVYTQTVTNLPSRRQPECRILSSSWSIATLSDIEDKQLRKAAEKLIAKIRFKHLEGNSDD